MAFRDIVGHRSLVQLLARSIHRNTLPPSLILAGPEGVGKRLTALSGAQALNCLSPVPEQTGTARAREGRKAGTTHEREGRTAEALEIDACGVCPVCSRIARGITMISRPEPSPIRFIICSSAALSRSRYPPMRP